MTNDRKTGTAYRLRPLGETKTTLWNLLSLLPLTLRLRIYHRRILSHLADPASTDVSRLGVQGIIPDDRDRV